MKSRRKLKRKRNQRRALLRGLASSLIVHKKIRTTEAKAKAMRPFVERLVTVAKTGTLSSRRRVTEFLPPAAAHDIIHKIAPIYKDRDGGYTRIIKTGRRQGDNAPTVFIEFV